MGQIGFGGCGHCHLGFDSCALGAHTMIFQTPKGVSSMQQSDPLDPAPPPSPRSECGAAPEQNPSDPPVARAVTDAMRRNTTLSDQWAWALVSVPILGMGAIYLVASAIGAFSSSWVIFIAINFGFVFLDMQELKKARIDTGKWGALGFVLVPVYLVMRANKTNENYLPAIAWCVSFTLSLYLEVLSSILVLVAL
jgi:hypothetical protein